MDVYAEVARARHALADQIDALDASALDAESWCAGWTCRHVLGHLVHLAESTQGSMMRDMLRNGPSPDKALATRARAVAAAPVAELTARLRAAADGRFHVVGTPSVVVLGEVQVHGSDLLRPLGKELPVEPSTAVPVINAYRRVGWVAFHGAPGRKVTLVATDTDHRIGKGPEVRGRAIDLVLLLANRKQALDVLEGPGLDLLRG